MSPTLAGLLEAASSAVGFALAIALVTALATECFARLAQRIGWTDAPGSGDTAAGATGSGDAAAAPAPDRRRKRQRRPVPTVGGAALLVGLACAGELPPTLARQALWGPWLPSAGWFQASLVALFLLGTLDDRRGLRAAPKVIGQLLALAPLAWGSGLQHGPGPALGCLLLGLVALNVLNTFDNADGALAGLGLLGFGLAGSPVAAVCLGFLPLNLDAGRARNRASGAPSAYLGDAGAFVLALLVLAVPASAGLLVLPALDLARLAVVRCLGGSRPWIGDRLHLAHRLEARGLTRVVVALVLALISGPACALVALAVARGEPALGLLGGLATGVLWGLALLGTPAPGAGQRASGPAACPTPDRAE